MFVGGAHIALACHKSNILDMEKIKTVLNISDRLEKVKIFLTDICFSFCLHQNETTPKLICMHHKSELLLLSPATI